MTVDAENSRTFYSVTIPDRITALYIGNNQIVGVLMNGFVTLNLGSFLAKKEWF